MHENIFLKILSYASLFVFRDRPTQVKGTIGDWKVMLIMALHQNQIIAYQILPRNRNVNHDVYLEFLEQYLLPAVKRKRIRRPYIIHDNARPHKHPDIGSFFNRHGWIVLKHPPYSPDLNPCDYDGFHRLKAPNKGIRFSNETELANSYGHVINELNQKNSFIGISRLPQRWEQVIQNCGEYVL